MASAASIAVQLQKLSNEATEKSFKYNQQEANTARAWQKQMSDTAHQREVADLKKAGLNPILSAGSSGAQSYTTSAASAQAENAANAVGNVWSAQMSADATRAAAAQNAAAMKQAAATSAAAQRYAAAMAFESQKYHSDKAYEATKYKADTEYKTSKYKVDNTHASNPFQLADKYLQNSGISKTVLNGVLSKANNFLKNPQKIFQDIGKNINSNNFKLNSFGLKQINNQLSKLNLANTNTNRNLFVKAFVFGSKPSINTLSSLIRSANKAKVAVSSSPFSYSSPVSSSRTLYRNKKSTR